MEAINDRLKTAAEEKFITIPGEELILVQRKYFVTLLFPVFLTIASAIFFSAIFFGVFILVFYHPAVFIAALITILVATLTALTKLLIDWYFNFYVVTNRKILEIRYAPLVSKQINKVLLDQVRCTEIDSKTDGLLNEMLDVGDITMTFDRPTHREEFVFTSVKDPKEVERYLESTLVRSIRQFDNGTFENIDGFWNKSRGDSKWQYKEELQVEPYVAAN